MAGYVNRSTSVLAAGDGPHNRTVNGVAPVASAVTDAPLSAAAGGPTRADTSPLQIFVKAKKKINDIFVDIEGYVGDACDYMHSLDVDVATATTVDRVAAYTEKVHGIRDVLTRDHMKVAFFGRTSNGKSTVINAMLRDKILPSGIGHTTNCFLQVEGSDSSEAYLVTEQRPTERQNVKSVGQLAHALCKEKLSESQLVRVYWPRDKCLLLRDDVVFVDSPGIDVTPNLDEWIDKHCLDADVFVLVANAESTLMVTEKNFFHKVSTKLSKPNIFILNNRWDASASEPEFLDQVRRQHQERGIDFLVRELRVCEAREAEERIFFVSAKEALQARMAEQNGTGMQPPFADGFQTRYFEFQDFERRFEECISKSAVRTKFEQHGQRGRAIVSDIRAALDEAFMSAHAARERLAERRSGLRERLDHTEQQLLLVTADMKDKIRRIVEDVEQRVSRALSEEIRRLAVLIDEFSVPFHPEPVVLNVYKRELHAYVELGLGSNLRARLSTALALNIEQSQRDMVDRMERLLLPITNTNNSNNSISITGIGVGAGTGTGTGTGTGAGVTSATAILPRRQPFEILYRLNCDNLCADFHEDLEFRFSWGITSLVQRFAGSRSCQRFLLKQPRSAPVPPLVSPMDGPAPPPPTVALVPSAGPPAGITPEDWSLLSKVALASVSGSQGTVGGLFVAGFLLKTVGWRLIVITGVVYSCLYLYERLTWTNKAKERLFKRQYVQHATKKLRMIVDLTSANCSHQVQQELSGTFARLCHLVDEATDTMDTECKQLDGRIRELEEAAAAAKVLKNKANYITHELDLFEDAYLRTTH